MTKKKSPPTLWEIAKPILNKDILAKREVHPNMPPKEVILI
jgi:hypothetical protein